MECYKCYMLGSALLFLLVAVESMSIPTREEMSAGQLEDEGQILDNRASWLTSRDEGNSLESDFVTLVEVALRELVADGKLNAHVFNKAESEVPGQNDVMQKRGRFQGFCFRKTSTGRFLPYVCWKQDRRRR